MENKSGIKILVLGAFLQLFLGIIYVWSVFVKPVSVYFDWDEGAVKLTASFMLCCFVLGILTGGKLILKIGSQRVILAGGLLMMTGMLTTAFIPAGLPWLIYITYGVIGGFGVGMGYNANITAAQKWFPKKRGLATGVSVFAFGFSTVIFAPLAEFLIGKFGLQNTFFILASAFGAVTLLLFSFIKLPENPAAAVSASTGAEKRQYTTSEMIKTKEFYFLTLSMMFLTAAFFILNPSFKSLAAERGLSENIGTLLVMITGIANALGRLFVPLLSDKIGREEAAFCIIAATALSALSLCFVSGALFVAAVALIAFCYGGSSGIYPVITADHFGVKNIGANYGAVMMGFASSALLFPIIFNQISDIFIKFISLAAIAGIGAVLVLLLKRGKQTKNN